MKILQRMSICVAVAMLVCGLAGSAFGASVSGRSSTVLEWFDDAQEDTAVPIYEYLLLNVKDIDGKGLNFRGYGRLADDLADEVDVDSELYYAYLEKKGILDNLDFRLGRQFISTTAGASLMDGLKLDYGFLGNYRLSLFGGGDVTYYEGYNADDLIAGTELSGRFLQSLDLGLSYLQKWEGGDLSHELIGFDLDYDFRNLLNLYNETQYSWLTEEITYFLAGFKYHRSPKWSLRAEYLYSLPVFSATSIYSVFAVDEYQEVMGELGYNIDTGLRAFARYARELYESVDDANVYEAGIEKIRTARLSGYLTGTVRDDGEGQDLYGFKAYLSWLFNQYFDAGVGAHVDVLERRLEEDDETTSSRLWADATVYFTRKVNVQGKVERVESDLWDEYYRGRVRLNILF
ncbi:hypothetical protein DESUT3_30650 [Desulfuromonas versatilis]|uniref:Uncharacterized protein n=1 Tax=Desulfuromonas versatilis TaxID=2802975 RepID=A0ABN6E4G3_9BACT|nr:hypothetical protein [Desulfuromonas versatilis]BCR05996.1 hypothetical protein DESUT3_30650 [Desulfuromonas versatilis]